jgi:phage tail-like protein
MSLPRPFSLVRTADQWRRAAFQDTALLGDTVQLAWKDEEIADEALQEPLPVEGMAFDENCRLYATVRAEGRVERLLWANGDKAEAIDFLVPPEPQPLGDFMPVPGGTPAMEPVALAVDQNQRLFVGDAAARAIHIFDLWSHRLIRSVLLASAPVDLAFHEGFVYVLLSALDSGASLVDANTIKIVQPPAGVTAPSRLAIADGGEILVLDKAGTVDARIVTANRSHAVPRATDIEFLGNDILIVARWPGQDFLRLRWTTNEIASTGTLKAKNYDGRGIVRTPDDRIVFRTSNGLRHAVSGRLRLRREGRVTTFQLDSGEFQTTWGRIFLDACIPRDTAVHLHCVAVDEPPVEPALPRTPPANIVSVTVPRPDLSPPMPPISLVPAGSAIGQRVHERETGHEMPWVERAAGDRFETYEAPVIATPGRFLWITIKLSGNGVLTPQIRAVRAEHVPHDLMRKLPQVYSREDSADGFLRRYLATFDGTLAELDARSFSRRAILDPRSAPPEMLSWLAGFVGLLTDERWPVEVKRTLIEEAIWLFRFRGTVPGLRRFLEIYLGRPATIIEKFRTRGLGGAFVGGSDALEANSILGAGFRIGGAVGTETAQFIEGNADDAFETHAHRFTVVIQAVLTEEQMSVVRHILDVHRPAHTLVDVCTVGAGMRVGRGLHVELTSIIGPSGGFQPIRVAGSPLGRGGILGRPGAGTYPGASKLGKDTRVG